jgi:general transcription factor 3C polypeptide 3 (transcription factor C subunit 4)
MAIEPYNMMGLAYEELGDMARALQFKLVGAHLNPKDSGRWVELAGWSRCARY